MNESLLAGRYAKALLAYAEEAGEADALYEVFLRVGRELSGERRVRAVIGNPTLPEAQRREVAVSLAGEMPPESFVRFVDLVFCHHRERMFGEMVGAYTRLYRRRKGIIRAHVVFASEPEESLLDRLREVLHKQFGGTVELEVAVDQGLLGGFLLRVEGRVLDASAKGALEHIRRQLVSRNRSIV